jgi:hypothetical protein
MKKKSFIALAQEGNVLKLFALIANEEALGKHFQPSVERYGFCHLG